MEAQTSDLWGQGGERWAGSSILPDFSYAGYHFGEQEIPTPQVKANVLNFGAKGDGKTDDTMAFVKAIDAVDNGAVFIPPGRYVIKKVLFIWKSNVVLRGAELDQTILYFPDGLLKTLGKQSGTGESDNWSWSGGQIWIEGEENCKQIKMRLIYFYKSDILFAPEKNNHPRGRYQRRVQCTKRIR